jgi:hypothetical protein
MPNRTAARSAKADFTKATGRLPLLRLFSTPLKMGYKGEEKAQTSGNPCFQKSSC